MCNEQDEKYYEDKMREQDRERGREKKNNSNWKKKTNHAMQGQQEGHEDLNPNKWWWRMRKTSNLIGRERGWDVEHRRMESAEAKRK